jgi:hypothetical protein
MIRIEGAPSHESLTPMIAVLREMLAQWSINGVIRSGGVELLEAGAFLAVAYEPAGSDISGCTKDQLTHALLDFEKRLGFRLINASPLVVELEGNIRFMDREEFRRLRSEGTVNEQTVVFDYLIDSLSDLGRFRTTVGQSWYARVGKPKAVNS